MNGKSITANIGTQTVRAAGSQMIFRRETVRVIPWLLSGAATLGLTMGSSVQAKVSAEEAARLDGPQLTCMGAERAGSASGIPEYSGKWVGTWPGQSKPYGYEPGPYANEKPLFTITAKDVAKYADKLTEGEKALFAAYPQTYRMLVYPSHRDFGTPKWACETAKKNALSAELIDDGLGATGLGGGPAFPIPKSGLEAIRSVQTSFRAWTEKGVLDIAQVYAGGNIAWGRNKFLTMNPMNKPGEQRPSLSEKINAYFYDEYQLPQRDRGMVSVGFQVTNYKLGSTQAWQYLPGTRRVRQAPEVGFDYPVPPAGMHTTDEDYGFNGSPERYNWKLVGKKEFYVPYNNFKINDPALKYKDILTTGSINPQYVRYELHRVWVIEADLKPGMRHVYAKRRLYVDEDSWQIMLADQYDGRGQLWRIPMILYFYSQESGAYHRGLQVFHDLTAKAYEASNLLNEREPEDWWRINQPMSPSQFTADAAARAGR